MSTDTRKCSTCFEMKPLDLELTHIQLWLIGRALLMLTTEEGSARLRHEFPYADMGAISKELDALVNKIGAANKKEVS